MIVAQHVEIKNEKKIKEELKDNDISDYISKIIIKIFIYITN